MTPVCAGCLFKDMLAVVPHFTRPVSFGSSYVICIIHEDLKFFVRYFVDVYIKRVDCYISLVCSTWKRKPGVGLTIEFVDEVTTIAIRLAYVGAKISKILNLLGG